MKIKTKFLMLGCLSSFWTSQAAKPHNAVKQKAFNEAVAKAMPSITALKKPKKSRKVLVLSKVAGWYHSSIETGKTCFKLMGEQTGAFEVDFIDEPSFFTSENLKTFDVLLFNNTTYCQDYFNEEQRQAILNYVKNGGGFVGIHAASDCGTSKQKSKTEWPEITRMIGGAFNGHPWTSKGMYGIRNEDPNHTIIKHLNGEGFDISDELYKYKDYDRKSLRVLLSIDMEKSYKKGGRKDHDNPLLWVKKYGKGRVFFSAFGHNEAVFANPIILQSWLNGIQFSAGDLQVELSSLPQPKISKNFDPKKKSN